MSSKSICVVANGRIFLFPLCVIYIISIIFIHSSVDRHLSCFHILAIVNKAAINMAVHLYLQYPVLIFFGVYPEVEQLDPY